MSFLISARIANAAEIKVFTTRSVATVLEKIEPEFEELVRSGRLNYSWFVREIESVGFYDDMVIIMGLEILTPSGDNAKAGQIIRRRYTNIWMKRKGKWFLTARHANIICQ